MSIKVRLLLSYILMILIPVVVLGGAAAVIGEAFAGNLKSAYQLDTRQNPVLAVLEREAGVSAEIQLRGTSNPDSMLDPSVQAALDENLRQINMGLIVRRDNEIVYISPNMNRPELLRNLPPYGQKERDSHDHSIGEGGHWFIARQHDMAFKGGSRGSAFIVTDINALGKFARTYSTLFFAALLTAVVLTNGLLTYFVSRSIIRPLRLLKKAADEIKEGNLDFEVKPEANDEIGSLAVSFEQMRQKLKESVGLQLQYEENRKELISNISHDLKTPITAIKGYVEGIMDGITDTSEKRDKYVKTIYTKAVQMDQMIEELFLFSKLDLKKQPFHFEQVELASFLKDCMEELGMDTEMKRISLKLDMSELGAEAPVWVQADRDKLKRVLMNIIGNAAKYMDKTEGKICIRVHGLNRFVAIEVEDNGQGIAEEALPYIFDRFYRADLSRNAGTGGSGLGLAIAKQIVEGHGGTIWASSRPGAGTSIQFTLQKGESASYETNPDYRR